MDEIDEIDWKYDGFWWGWNNIIRYVLKFDITTTTTTDIIYVDAGATVTKLIYKIIVMTQEREPYRNFFLRFVYLFLCFLFAAVFACLLFDIELRYNNNGNNGNIMVLFVGMIWNNIY